MSEEQKKSMLAGIGGAADKVMGDIVLGGIGQGAFLVHQIPGVKQATTYIGENIADGWNAAEARQQKGVALRLVQELVTRKDVPDQDEIRKACVKAGINEDNLDEVAKAAHMAVSGKAAAMASLQKTDSKPQETTASVPLPQVTGQLQPAVG